MSPVEEASSGKEDSNTSSLIRYGWLGRAGMVRLCWAGWTGLTGLNEWVRLVELGWAGLIKARVAGSLGLAGLEAGSSCYIL